MRTAFVVAVSAIIVLLSPSLFAGSSVNPPGTTNSAKYQGLVEDNEARMRFTDGQNAKLDRYLKASPHFTSVKGTLEGLYSGPTIRATVRVDATHVVQWLDQGLGKPSEISLLDTTGSQASKLLYSTFNNGIGISASIDSLSLSPKGDFLLIIVAHYGSIDQVRGLVVDLHKRAIVAKLDMYENEQAWISPSTLQYTTQDDEGSPSDTTYDVTLSAGSSSQASLFGQSKDFAVLVDNSGAKPAFTLVNKHDGSKTAVELPGMDTELAGNDQAHVYFLVQDHAQSKILSADWPATTVSLHALVIENKVFLERLWTDEGLLAVLARAGADRWIRIYDPGTGALTREIPVPDCCSPSSVAWAQQNKSLNIVMTSPMVASSPFTYDLSANSWSHDPNSVMLTANGVNYKSEVFMAKSADGTAIPTRMVFRADLARDGSRPVIMMSYGGFGIDGYIDPHFDRPTLDFLSKGGIFAAAALRGGNEYGAPWHEQAMGANKIKTFQDLDAAARQLVNDGWTTAKKIAIRGTSNGGLTTAATALLFPNDFGLAIPIAGVDDLLAKDTLDAENSGWSYEYGSEVSGAAYLPGISPLENAGRQGQVRFLIVDGQDDTRVNPAHSVKLAKAMLDQGGNPANAFLLTVANAGHGVESVGAQNSIGLETEIVVWSMIYDMAGF